MGGEYYFAEFADGKGPEWRKYAYVILERSLIQIVIFWYKIYCKVKNPSWQV